MQNRNDVNLRLIKAAENGWTENIRAALEAGADVNYVDARDESRNTALILALMYGYPDAAYLLLEQGNIHINYAAKSGVTALSQASKGYTEILRFILEKPDVDVNAVDGSGMSALMHALDHGHRDVAFLLLAREKIDLNLVSLQGHTALYLACLRGLTDIVRLILQRKNIDVNCRNKTGWTPLTAAVGHGHTEIVRLLLERDDIAVNEVTGEGNSALLLACGRGQTAVVRLLLAKEGIEINQARAVNGLTPLGFACERGYAPIVRLLLEHGGIDISFVNLQGRMKSSLALRSKSLDVFHLILAYFVKTSGDPVLIADYDDRYKTSTSYNVLSAMVDDLFKRAIKNNQMEAIEITLKQINYLLSDAGGVELEKVRISMFNTISEHIQSIMPHANNEMLKEENKKLELIFDTLNVLQVSGSGKAEKPAKENLFSSMSELVLKAIPNKIVLFAEFLDGVLGVANKKSENVNQVISETLLKQLSLYQINILRLFLKILTADQRETLKKTLFKAIERMNNKPLSGADARLMTDIHNKYVNKDQVALFYIFRMGDNNKVEHDTGTWNHFCDLMKKGRYMQYISKVGMFKEPDASQGDLSIDSEQLNRSAGFDLL